MHLQWKSLLAFLVTMVTWLAAADRPAWASEASSKAAPASLQSHQAHQARASTASSIGSFGSVGSVREPAREKRASVQKASAQKTGTPSRAAPLCDGRGATMFGATPTLDGPSASVDVGNADASGCFPAFEGDSYEQGRHPARASSGPVSPEAVLPRTAYVTPHRFVEFIAWCAAAERGATGVARSVERPPSRPSA